MNKYIRQIDHVFSNGDTVAINAPVLQWRLRWSDNALMPLWYSGDCAALVMH